MPVKTLLGAQAGLAVLLSLAVVAAERAYSQLPPPEIPLDQVPQFIVLVRFGANTPHCPTRNSPWQDCPDQFVLCCCVREWAPAGSEPPPFTAATGLRVQTHDDRPSLTTMRPTTAGLTNPDGCGVPVTW